MREMDRGTQPRGRGGEGSGPGDLSFEQALATLEETVEELRSDGLSLARALDLYEAGTRLAAYCEELLTAAELRLTRVDPSGRGVVETEVIALRDVQEGRR